MTKQKEREQRKSECAKAGCKYYLRKCISLCDSDCTRLGGEKIPVHRVLEGVESFPAQRTHGMKAYFITDGHEMDEGR